MSGKVYGICVDWFNSSYQSYLLCCARYQYSPDVGFQYRNPRGEAFMKSEEYDDLIKDPTELSFQYLASPSFQDIVPPKSALFVITWLC